MQTIAVAELNGTRAGQSASPQRLQGSRSALIVPLLIHGRCNSQAVQPVTLGIPFPLGSLREPRDLSLVDDDGRPVLLQTLPLARWPDGSVKWLLLDFVLGSMKPGPTTWTLRENLARPGAEPQGEALRIIESGQTIVVDSGVAEFHLNRTTLQPFTRVLLQGQDVLAPSSTQITLTDTKGRKGTAQVERVSVEAQGPVRCTVLLEGTFIGRVRCRFAARLCFFSGTGLVRIRLTVHNPRRARHRRGLWDLGDPGSMFFRDLALEWTVTGSEGVRTCWAAEVGQPLHEAASSFLEIYQDSSGGENWQSRNHVNHLGRVPCSFRGYRVRTEQQVEAGLRASPTVCVRGATASVTVAVPEFWQQFPKAIEVERACTRVRLFPQQYGDLFELQGGEQKTHTLWLDFALPEPSAAPHLDWAHEPARVSSTPQWYAVSGAIPYFTPAQPDPDDRLESLLSAAVTGPNTLFARREIIDEYGWRHFGEVYADHEAAYYTGPPPVISHYNNQYDLIHGTLLQYLRSGEPRWFELSDALARHVIDIDIYHTDRDKAAYNGGLFWFTDHYKDAATCTHRTYSRHNCLPGDRSYGGGPSSNHNFATGLLYYYYITGDPDARAAVLSLANWVIQMDDGRNNVLGLVDSGATGLASSTGQLDYQGPGRGAGNSINALLDAWIISEQRRYLGGAETILHRCVHPRDKIEDLDLLHAEKRWSYTVFLSTLARYLDIKEEAGELDESYAYARASLVHYAEWMWEKERPYFDQVEQLEYPTEAWAAQELRKANVLRFAARYVDEPLRARLLQRADELSDRGWADLHRFETRTVARTLAIVLAEGPKEVYFRLHSIKQASPRLIAEPEFGKPTTFIPQKTRVTTEMQSIAGLLRLLRSASPWSCWKRRSRARF
jgi:hypothetical protein